MKRMKIKRLVKRPRLKLNNFRYLLLSSSISAFMGGIFGPFYILYIQRIGGGIENFGFAFGLFSISSSLTSYIIGKYSDRIGRKPFMLFSSFVAMMLMVIYVFIRTTTQLFTIQVFFGINDAVWRISEKAFLADITKRKSRGRMLGKYDATLSMLEGVAMLFSGILVGQLGFEIIFYMMALAIAISTIPLFFIKE